MVTKEKYEAPELFVESFMCDRGFDASMNCSISDGEGDGDDEFETIYY